MSDHERHWNDLLANEDPRIALREHFAFLTDDPVLSDVLDEVFERFEGAEIEDDRLVVAFEEEFELRCDPPADEGGPTCRRAFARMRG